MEKRQYLRGTVDETIIGGPFVRYTPDSGTVFMITEKVGKEEFLRAICPVMIQDKWGSFTVGAFQMVGCDETEDYWVEQIEEIIVTEAMIVYQVPKVGWMDNWQKKNGA